ncbi:MAG: methylmalonyl-CoA epimerase [Hyphomicrobiaceae bacterium]
MKVKRIEHVAIAVKSIAAMREIFEQKLGLEMEYEEELPQYSTKLAMFPIGETYLELLQSDKPGTGTSKWIAERGEGLFHLCLEVEDIEAALAELKGRGVKLIDETPRIGHGNSRIAFIDPSSTGGLLFELVEAQAGAHQGKHAAE